MVQTVDPRSAWALGDFRGSHVKLQLLGDSFRGNGTGAGVRSNVEASIHDGDLLGLDIEPSVAYQGERLTGKLIVQFATSTESGELDERGYRRRLERWRQFGDELNVEIEITTEAAAAATSAGENVSLEEPSLWREYEGRENARDAGVLSRTSRCVRLESTVKTGDGASSGDHGDLSYVLHFEVQVPVEFLGKAVMLEALVSPASYSQREEAAASVAIPFSSAGAGTGAVNAKDVSCDSGIRAGVRGEFARRLDGLFAHSRLPAVRPPVKRCCVPLRVVQPIAVSSTSSSPTPTPSPSLSLGRCLVSLEVRNEHPRATLVLHEVEAHVDGTASAGERASQKLPAPCKSSSRIRRRKRGVGRGGAGTSGSEEMGVVSSPAALEGLERAIEQPRVPPPGSRHVARVFCSSWIAKPTFPLRLAPGDVQGMVLALSPDPVAEPLLPRRAGGQFETPVTFVWSLGFKEGDAAAVDRREASTSVHLAQWRAEDRARDEVLVRVRGQPRVKLNDVFEVSLLARNLSPGTRDLVVMFTEDAPPSLPTPIARARRLKKLALERTHGGAGGLGVSRDTIGDGEGSETAEELEAEEDDDDEERLNLVSPAGSPAKPRGAGSSIPGHRSAQGSTGAASGSALSGRPSGGGVESGMPVSVPGDKRSLSHASATTSFGDLIPLDAAVPLGRLDRGAEGCATVRLTAARVGLARLSTLCLRDKVTGAVYAPASPFEVFVES